MAMSPEPATDVAVGPGADRVLHCLREAAEALTVSQLVERTRLHENAVRRNLKRLEERGDVHVQRNEPEPSRRGRPALRYRGVGSRETPYRELLPPLLALLADADVGQGEAYRAGRAHGRTSAPAGDTRGAMLTSLAKLGFAPADDARPGTPQGVDAFLLTACPFADMVTRPGGRRLCALHHGMLAGVAEARGGQVEDFAIVNPNADHCRLLVRRHADGDGAGPNGGAGGV